MSASPHLPPELLLQIFQYALPSCGDVDEWKRRAQDLCSWSLVNSSWKVAQDELYRHLVVTTRSGNNDLRERFDAERRAEEVDGQRMWGALGQPVPPLETGPRIGLPSHCITSLHLLGKEKARIDFHDVFALMLRLPKLKELVLLNCDDVDLGKLVVLEDLIELHCIDTTIVDLPRLVTPNSSLKTRRLVLTSSLLPTSFPTSYLRHLTHLAQINVIGLSAASFDRDAWLTELAPRLQACALTLVGSGWHSDLPILQAMRKIRILDLFIPYAVGLSVATILEVIGTTIEHLRVEVSANKFADLVEHAEKHEKPGRLMYLGIRVKDNLDEDMLGRLSRAWRGVVIRVQEACKKKKGFEELFWDEVERGRLG